MERNNKLLKNTSILMIGGLATRGLAILLVPLYSHYINPVEFGTVDIYMQILNIVYVVISLQLIESSFRFVQDCNTEQEKSNVISNSFYVILISVTFYSIIFMLAFNLTFELKIIFIAYVVSNIFSNFFLHTLRGLDKANIYVLGSIVITVINLLTNILLLVLLKYGENTLLIAPIIANLSCLMVVLTVSKIYKYINVKYITFEMIKRQLKFSIPLIPNAISIWLMAAVGKFILIFFKGVDSSGLFAMANKIPLLIATFAAFFQMAWQVNAVTEYNSEDRDEYFSSMKKKYTVFMMITAIVSVPATKIFVDYFISIEYATILQYYPILVLAVVFKVLTEFTNSVFYSAKKTSFIFISSLLGALIYIGIALLFVNEFAIYAVAVGYLVGEIGRYIYSSIKVRKHVNMKNNVVQVVLLSVMVFLIFEMLVMIDEIYFTVFMFLILLIIFLVYHRYLIKKIYVIILERLGYNG